MLVARNYQPGNLVRLLPAPAGTSPQPEEISRSENWRGRPRGCGDAWVAIPPEFTAAAAPQPRRDQGPSLAHPELNDLLYLFACQVEWLAACRPQCGVGSYFCRAQPARRNAGPRPLLARTFAADGAAIPGRHSHGLGRPGKFNNGGRYENSQRS